MSKVKSILKVLFIMIAILAILTLILFFWNRLLLFFSDMSYVKEFILGFGYLAPFVFILLVILQVLFAPIPGQFIGFVGGFLFGVYLGTLYSMIGLIIGSWLVFVIARKLGRPFVEKIVNGKTLRKFDRVIAKNGKFSLFLIYLLPAFPDDLISYIAGLTKIRMSSLVLISAIGRLPGFIILNMVGAGIASQNSGGSIVVFIVLMIISFFIYWYHEALERLFMKVVRKKK